MRGNLHLVCTVPVSKEGADDLPYEDNRETGLSQILIGGNYANKFPAPGKFISSICATLTASLEDFDKMSRSLCGHGRTTAPG